MASLFKNIYVSWAKRYHSVAQAEWGAHLPRQSTGNRQEIRSRRRSTGFVLAGDYRAFRYPVWSGALASGGGHAFGCVERDPPPHVHGVSNREHGGGARGIVRESRFSVFTGHRQCLRSRTPGLL